MSFSNKIKNSFNDYYNLKRLYYQTLYKDTKSVDSDVMFFGDLKVFDKIERWFNNAENKNELPQEIKNMVIMLSNCFGREFVLRWFETYLYGGKELTVLDELDNGKYYEKGRNC